MSGYETGPPRSRDQRLPRRRLVRFAGWEPLCVGLMRYETAASVDSVTAPSGRSVVCGVVVGLASGLITGVLVSFVAATTGSWLAPVGALRLVGEQLASRGRTCATRKCRLICREQRRSGVVA